MCAHAFPRKPILYAFPAVADLKDLTVFVMMMNKSKVFEDNKEMNCSLNLAKLFIKIVI